MDKLLDKLIDKVVEWVPVVLIVGVMGFGAYIGLIAPGIKNNENDSERAAYRETLLTSNKDREVVYLDHRVTNEQIHQIIDGTNYEFDPSGSRIPTTDINDGSFLAFKKKD